MVFRENKQRYVYVKKACPFKKICHRVKRRRINIRHRILTMYPHRACSLCVLLRNNPGYNAKRYIRRPRNPRGYNWDKPIKEFI